MDLFGGLKQASPSLLELSQIRCFGKQPSGERWYQFLCHTTCPEVDAEAAKRGLRIRFVHGARIPVGLWVRNADAEEVARNTVPCSHQIVIVHESSIEQLARHAGVQFPKKVSLCLAMGRFIE